MASLMPVVEELAGGSAIGQGVPAFFDVAFEWFHRAHRLWRWQRRIQQVTGSVLGFKQILAGYATQLALGDSRILKVAAQSVLIARRLVDAGKNQDAFHCAGRRLIEALCAKHVRCLSPIRVEALARSPLSYILPLSTIAWFLQTAQQIIYYIGDVLRSAASQCHSGYRLSMSLMDLTLAASLSQESQSEAVQELYFNSAGLVQDLVDHKLLLIKALREYKPVIERILELCEVGYSVEDLIRSVQHSIEGTAEAYGLLCKVLEATEEHAKHGLYALCLNLWGSAPSSLLPRKILQEKAERQLPHSDFYSELA